MIVQQFENDLLTLVLQRCNVLRCAMSIKSSNPNSRTAWLRRYSRQYSHEAVCPFTTICFPSTFLKLVLLTKLTCAQREAPERNKVVLEGTTAPSTLCSATATSSGVVSSGKPPINRVGALFFWGIILFNRI